MKTLSLNALRLCIIDAVINMDIADIQHYTRLLEVAIKDIKIPE